MRSLPVRSLPKVKLASGGSAAPYSQVRYVDADDEEDDEEYGDDGYSSSWLNEEGEDHEVPSAQLYSESRNGGGRGRRLLRRGRRSSRSRPDIDCGLNWGGGRSKVRHLDTRKESSAKKKVRLLGA